MGDEGQASKRALRDVEGHEDKEDLVVMLLEVILKKDAPVLDILCRSGEFDPLAPIPMNKWEFGIQASSQTRVDRYWRAHDKQKKWLAYPQWSIFLLVPEL